MVLYNCTLVIPTPNIVKMTVGEAKTASRVNTRAALPSNITASSLSGIQNCFPLGSTTFKGSSLAYRYGFADAIGCYRPSHPNESRCALPGRCDVIVPMVCRGLSLSGSALRRVIATMVCHVSTIVANPLFRSLCHNGLPHFFSFLIRTRRLELCMEEHMLLHIAPAIKNLCVRQTFQSIWQTFLAKHSRERRTCRFTSFDQRSGENNISSNR